MVKYTENFIKEWFLKNFPKAEIKNIFKKESRKNRMYVTYVCSNTSHKETSRDFGFINNKFNKNNLFKLPCMDCRDYHENDIRDWFAQNKPNAIVHEIYTKRLNDKSKLRRYVKYRCSNPTHVVMDVSFTNIQSSFKNKRHLPCIDCQSCSHERIVKFYFEQIFGSKFNKIRPIWLKPNRFSHSLELDGYANYTINNQTYNLAFEYQGEQHYEPRRRSKSQTKDEINKQFKHIQLCDKNKLEICKLNNIKLYIIPCNEIKPHSNLINIIKRLSVELEVPFPEKEININLDEMTSTSNSEESLNKLVEKLDTLEFDLLSKAWILSNSKYQIVCRICKTKFNLTANYLMNKGSHFKGCSTCNHKDKNVNHNNQ